MSVKTINCEGIMIIIDKANRKVEYRITGASQMMSIPKKCLDLVAKEFAQ
jgi:hypothetical protein